MSPEFSCNPQHAIDTRRFYELDSLRGLAAFTVVLFHFSLLGSPDSNYLFFRTPLRLLVAGPQAVILFFLLSGFVLTLPYQRRSSLGYASFLLKRICRIYLPYLGALALAVLGDRYLPGHGPYKSYYLNLTWSVPVTIHLIRQHILFIGSYDWAQLNLAFWSLVNEMRISLAFPFIAVAVLRGRNAWILFSAFAMSLACFPLATVFWKVFPLSTANTALRSTLTLHYAALFVIGSLIAKNLPAINRWYSRSSTLQSALLAFTALLFYFFGSASSIVQRFPAPKELYDWPVALGSAIIIVLAINSRPFHRFLTSRTIHHLGKISYSLYLIHGTVLFALVHTLYHRVPTAALLLPYLGITLAVTEVFYHAVERPAMLLGRRLTSPLAAAKQPPPKSRL